MFRLFSISIFFRWQFFIASNFSYRHPFAPCVPPPRIGSDLKGVPPAALRRAEMAVELPLQYGGPTPAPNVLKEVISLQSGGRFIGRVFQ